MFARTNGSKLLSHPTAPPVQERHGRSLAPANSALDATVVTKQYGAGFLAGFVV
jgi:hypothetical protein